MGTVLLRPWLPPGLGIALPNLLQMAACLLVARGVRIFVRRPGADRTLLALAGGAALAVVVVNLIGLSLDWTVVLAGGAMAWLLLRAALDVRRGLAGRVRPAGRPGLQPAAVDLGRPAADASC